MVSENKIIAAKEVTFGCPKNPTKRPLKPKFTSRESGEKATFPNTTVISEYDKQNCKILTIKFKSIKTAHKAEQARKNQLTASWYESGDEKLVI